MTAPMTDPQTGAARPSQTTQQPDRGAETLKKHAALFDDMGKAMGIDLQEEALSGHLQFDEIADAVLRCTRCACPKTCRLYMDGLKAPIEQTPDYCRNSDLLAYLKEED